MRARVTALLVLAAVPFVAGCGDDDEPKIPRAEAQSLRADLLEAKRRLRPLRCGDLEEDSFPKLEDRIAQLPEGSDVRDTLEEGVDHLRSLVEADCAARREEQEETTTTDTETTETETTTEPPTTEPEPPTTTETQPPTTEPEPEPEPEPQPEPGNGGQGVPQGAVKPKKPKKDEG
jgi:hypothetical protein